MTAYTIRVRLVSMKLEDDKESTSSPTRPRPDDDRRVPDPACQGAIKLPHVTEIASARRLVSVRAARELVRPALGQRDDHGVGFFDLIHARPGRPNG